MKFKSQLAQIAERLTGEIKTALEAELDRSRDISPLIADMVGEISIQAQGGKRVRGALMYYGYQLCGGDLETEIIKAGVFIELIQTYLLIHDDFVDDDDLRRGVQTLHSHYADLHHKKSWRGDGKHFGQSVAVCAGDVVSHLAHEILLGADFPADRLLEAMRLLERQFQLVGYGQTLDVLAEVRPGVTEEEIIQLHQLKTGVYTYETPLLVSAILAGANPEQRTVLSKFAVPTGITFQLQDDILGMYADEDKLGKPVGSDLREGKYTLLIHKVNELGTPAQMKRMEKLNGKADLSLTELEEAREIIKESGSFAYSVDLSRNYIRNAKSILEKNRDKFDAEKSEEAFEFLRGMADYMLTREY